jgi:hypothetical protein
LFCHDERHGLDRFDLAEDARVALQEVKCDLHGFFTLEGIDPFSPDPTL